MTFNILKTYMPVARILYELQVFLQHRNVIFTIHKIVF